MREPLTSGETTGPGMRTSGDIWGLLHLETVNDG